MASLKKVWKGLRQGVATTLKVLINFIVSLPDTILTLFGVMGTKKLRVYVEVLANEDGPLVQREEDPQPPEPSGPSTAEWQKLNEAIDEARRILLEQANVRIEPADNEAMIRLRRDPAPPAALEVGCEGRAYLENLAEAGAYFEQNSHSTGLGTWLGYGAPITVFLVEDVVGKLGCSLGPLTDYVTVDLSGIVEPTSWTLTHELGHACNLWHNNDSLMRHTSVGRRDILKRWQKAMLRASRHVTYL